MHKPSHLSWVPLPPPSLTEPPLVVGCRFLPPEMQSAFPPDGDHGLIRLSHVRAWPRVLRAAVFFIQHAPSFHGVQGLLRCIRRSGGKAPDCRGTWSQQSAGCALRCARRSVCAVHTGRGPWARAVWAETAQRLPVLYEGALAGARLCHQPAGLSQGPSQFCV